jgi:tetratricopeptide (TPR) repeat protein
LLIRSAPTSPSLAEPPTTAVADQASLRLGAAALRLAALLDHLGLASYLELADLWIELAVSAFQGALAFHDDYEDAHYHLARTLDELDRADEAVPHWESFLRLAPSSPWADEARQRLGQ